MLTIQKAEFSKKLIRLYSYGFSHDPHSPICELGKMVAERLGEETVTPRSFVNTYFLSVADLCEKHPEYNQPSKYGHSVRENLVSLMCEVAEKLVSEEFSKEAFSVIQRLIEYLEIK